MIYAEDAKFLVDVVRDDANERDLRQLAAKCLVDLRLNYRSWYFLRRSRDQKLLEQVSKIVDEYLLFDEVDLEHV